MDCCWLLHCRATLGASQGTPWEWKGYRLTSTDKQKNWETYTDKQKNWKTYTDKQKDWKTYSDKQTDRQTYASSGSSQAANSASLLETLATFITPVWHIPLAWNVEPWQWLRFSRWSISYYLVETFDFSLQELICNLIAGQACGILGGHLCIVFCILIKTTNTK